MLLKIEQLKNLIEENTIRLRVIPEPIWAEKSDPSRWSKKEILGHLIDSAQNNLRRTIVAQYESGVNIIYDQDFWVQAQNYQFTDTDEIIQLWRLLNLQLVRAFLQMSPDKYQHTVNVGKSTIELMNMEELLDMYLEHTQHHLQQIY